MVLTQTEIPTRVAEIGLAKVKDTIKDITHQDNVLIGQRLSVIVLSKAAGVSNNQNFEKKNNASS